MKTYKVYRHPLLGYEAVKNGWSWPAFFFNWIWACCKQMWLNAFIILMVILFIETFVTGMLLGAGLTFSETEGVLWVLFLIMFVAIGMIGNELRRDNLIKKGYKILEIVQSESPEAAIGQVAKDEQSSTSDTSNPQVAE